jgi:enoyl-CoA hydratase
MEFLLCADLIPAEHAYEMGLLNAIVPREQLLDKAYEYARRITANAPLAVQATKQSVWEGLGMSLRDAYKNESQLSSTIFQTEDAKEGPKAFREKRTPNWQGK